MEENKIMEEVKDLIPEVTTEITIEDGSTGGSPIAKVLVMAGVAAVGAIAGYLFKRHRDSKWTKDFDGEDDYCEAEEEPEEDDSSEEKK